VGKHKYVRPHLTFIGGHVLISDDKRASKSPQNKNREKIA